MVRQVIKIDEEKCNGCGLCAEACHESAIGMVNGKAKLLRDDYCDGMGDCLPNCPAGAISFETREAAAYDREAVEENMRRKREVRETGVKGSNRGKMSEEKESDRGKMPEEKGLDQGKMPEEKGLDRGKMPEEKEQDEGKAPEEKSDQMKVSEENHQGGCPGSRVRQMKREEHAAELRCTGAVESRLENWPVQIKLAPVQAPYFDGANLLIAADCTAYAYGNFHQEFIRKRVTLIGCPKLDQVDYEEKLEAIIRQNNIKSVTIVRMEVPCCGGLELAAKRALQNSGKFLPWQVVIVTVDGKILDR